jgi:hypothetical protein
MTTNDERVERYAAPDRSAFMPQFLHSQILEDLWMGGTDDDDVLSEPRRLKDKAFITVADYDYVVTAYAWARPADWEVQEVRFPYYDSDDIRDLPIERVVRVAQDAHRAWKAGDRVLIRCQAGLNRSGLIMALVLILEGYEPREAIALMRAQRAPGVLCNRAFERFLLDTDMSALLR